MGVETGDSTGAAMGDATGDSTGRGVLSMEAMLTGLVATEGRKDWVGRKRKGCVQRVGKPLYTGRLPKSKWCRRDDGCIGLRVVENLSWRAHRLDMQACCCCTYPWCFA
jgi:hypothetical protein